MTYNDFTSFCGGDHGHRHDTTHRDISGRGRWETSDCRIPHHRAKRRLWHERMGLSTDEIASNYGLSLADVYAALAYYYDHRQEIDEAILVDESYVAELRNRIKSKLSGKIGG